MPTRSLVLLLLLLLARCGAGPVIDCDLTMVAQMPLQVQDHLLVVPAGINGKWVHLVVDSGAERTTISDAAAVRLRLPHDPRYVSRSTGIGGATTAMDVTIDRLVIGGVHIPVNRIAVGNFKLQTARGLDADGLLGADILLAFDMDIDVPDGKLTLYRSPTCPNMRPPWPQRAIEITGVRARKDRLLLPFELDNVPGMAVLDTGAQGNVIGVNMARRMGLDERTLAADPAVRQYGVGPGETISRLHQFSLFRIGPVVEEEPRMMVLPGDFGVGDALIGEEFLHGRRVWMSFRNRQVFVSRRVDEPKRAGP
jgi:predicted aspartyl protease